RRPDAPPGQGSQGHAGGRHRRFALRGRGRPTDERGRAAGRSCALRAADDNHARGYPSSDEELAVATFAYNAINAEGQEFNGTLAAVDVNAAIEALRQRGLLADRVEQVEESAVGAKSAAVSGKAVKPKSLQIFSRQFATMIEAGMNVVSSLVILEQQTNDVVLGDIIAELREDVERGLLLSEAMAQHPKVFSRLYIAMVQAGEAAGVLDVVLDRVALQIEKEEQIKRRVKSAMIYPTIVMIFAFLVLT